MTAVERAIMEIQNRIVCTPGQVEQLRVILKDMAESVFKEGWDNGWIEADLESDIYTFLEKISAKNRDWRDYEKSISN